MKRRGIASKERSQLVVENFYDLLPWRNTANNCFTQRFLPDASNEFSCDLKIDIRFEQRQAHLTQSSVDIRFADNPMPTELFENFLKLVAKLWKHNVITRSRAAIASKRGACAAQNYFFGVGAGGDVVPPA